MARREREREGEDIETGVVEYSVVEVSTRLCTPYTHSTGILCSIYTVDQPPPGNALASRISTNSS